MNTMREHLKEMHTAHADFHARAAKAHSNIAKCFDKMADGDENFSKLAEAHQSLADAHVDAGEFDVSCCKTLDMGKAMGMDGGDGLVPDFISSITPEVPANIKAVPRYGSPEIDLAKIEPALQRIVGIGGE